MYFLKLLLTFLFFSTLLNAKIILGVVPSEHKTILMKKYLPLAKYLSEKTNKEVEVKIGKSYEDVYLSLLKGKIQFAIMGPILSYKAMLASRYILPVVRFKRGHSSTYRVAIVANKKSNITRIRDFDSRYFGFGDKMSATTFLIPKNMLAMKGITLRGLSNYRFLGNETSILSAVIRGRVDGGALSEYIAKRYKKYLKIIALSKPILNYTICTNLKFSSRRDMLKIKKALLRIDDKKLLKALSPQFDGFKRASKIEYSKLSSFLK